MAEVGIQEAIGRTDRRGESDPMPVPADPGHVLVPQPCHDRVVGLCLGFDHGIDLVAPKVPAIVLVAGSRDSVKTILQLAEVLLTQTNL